jgi:hypothetical protein
MARQLIDLIDKLKIVELKVRDVDFALGQLAERFSTGSVRLARMILIQTWLPYPPESPVGRLSHSTWTRLMSSENSGD